MQILAAALAGLVFGGGLILSGMANPAVVLGFLDIFGDWNPALVFTMVGALAVTWVGYRLVLNRKPVFDMSHRLPVSSEIDMPLMVGAVLFGVGWGLAGLCPGPGIALIGIAPANAVVFLIAMAAGMLVTRLIWRLLGDAPPGVRQVAGKADG